MSCVPETMLAPEDGESESNASNSHTCEVPVLTFSLSITATGNASDAISDNVASALRTMWGTRAITEVDLLYDSNNSSRCMSTMRTLVVTLKYLTMEEAETFAEEVDLSIASDAVLDTLRQDEVLGIIDVQPSNVSVSLLPLICRANALVPPGVTIRNVEECLCTSGYEYLEESKGCSPCGVGEYKSTLANDKCQSCPIRKSTLKVGGASIQDCICQIGTFDAEGVCSDCTPGLYCPGNGEPLECPQHSQTLVASARSIDDCLCVAGHYSSGSCEPCVPGRYKSNIGNETCSQTCPSNADSYPGATSLEDCFCVKNYHAILSSNGRLERCASCLPYVGLYCPGGFEPNSTEHVQPRAAAGFYQTGSTFATKCRVVLADGSSACLGDNQCAEGTTGMLCGECPAGWAKFEDISPCEECLAGAGTGQLSTAIVFEITKIAALNFVLAALAASDAANANLPLHTYMIRILTQWFTACALITHFNLELLETPFAQASVSSDSCDEEQLLQYGSSSQAVAPKSTRTSDVNEALESLRLPWPVEVSHAIAVFFAISNVVPKFTSVKFSAQCRAFELFPERPGAQRLAPALYFISLPLLTSLATFSVCAVVVHFVVPVARRFGVHFNKEAKKKQKKRKRIQALFHDSWTRDLKLSDVPLDLPKFRGLDSFASIVDTHQRFAKEICRMKSAKDPQLEAVLAEEGLDLETFNSPSTDFLFAEFSEEDLKKVSCLQRRLQHDRARTNPTSPFQSESSASNRSSRRSVAEVITEALVPPTLIGALVHRAELWDRGGMFSSLKHVGVIHVRHVEL